MRSLLNTKYVGCLFQFITNFKQIEVLTGAITYFKVTQRFQRFLFIPEFSKPLTSATFSLHRAFYCVARTWVVIGCQRDLLLLEQLF